jgi:hypothetical protein
MSRTRQSKRRCRIVLQWAASMLISPMIVGDASAEEASIVMYRMTSTSGEGVYASAHLPNGDYYQQNVNGRGRSRWCLVHTADGKHPHSYDIVGPPEHYTYSDAARPSY